MIQALRAAVIVRLVFIVSLLCFPSSFFSPVSISLALALSSPSFFFLVPHAGVLCRGIVMTSRSGVSVLASMLCFARG